MPLPVHAVLQDAGGNDYVLVLAAIEDGLALNATVLDSDPSGAGYLVALERRRGAREAAANVFTILLDDGFEFDRLVGEQLPGLDLDCRELVQQGLVVLQAHDEAVTARIHHARQLGLQPRHHLRIQVRQQAGRHNPSRTDG